MTETLERFHNLLNREDILPEGYLARNHLCYPLVCYINIIIGLYMSHNYNSIPLFIKRAFEHLEIINDKITENESFRNLVLQYLLEMTRYILSLEIEHGYTDLIPKELVEKTDE